MIAITFFAKLFKASFWYALTITGLVTVEQTTTDKDFFLMIYESTPSFVLMGFGIVWIVAKALKEVSNTWFHHENNKINLKQNKEHLKQDEIETQKQEQDLND